MEKVEEISESESAKLNNREQPQQDDSKRSKENFQEILKGIDTDKGALVPIYPQGTYRIKKVAFGPGKCTIHSSTGSLEERSFSNAILQLGRSGFLSPYQKIKNTYQNP